MEEAHLFASDGAAIDNFGISVSISDSVAIVGAPGSDTTEVINTGSVYIYRFNGTNWIEEAQLFASDGAEIDNFGFSSSISGDVAIVGANSDDTVGGSNAGSAYVFRFNGKTWVEEAHLFASDGLGGESPPDTFGDGFGISVSVSDDTAIVGAWLDDTEDLTRTGSAYVYRNIGSTWIEVAHLFASGGSHSDRYGSAVSVSGDVGIVGAIHDDTAGGSSAGSAYVFSFSIDCNGNGIWDLVDIATGFSLDCNGNGVPDECELKGNDGNGNGVPDECDPDCNGNGIPDFQDIANGTDSDCNGNGVPDSCDLASSGSMDCNGNGIPDDCELEGNDINSNGVPDDCELDCNENGIPDELDVSSGFSVDCNGNFVPDSCEVVSPGPFQTGKLLATGGLMGDGFGAALDMEGNVMVVGGRTAIGSPYVYGFDGTSWVETGRLTASDGAALYFDVSIRGNLIIVGAPAANDSGSFTGAAYIFRYNGTVWEEEARLTASDGASNDAFGISVDIEGDTAIVGAWNADGVDVDTGAVYIFDFDGSSWTETQKIFASDGVGINFERFGFYSAIQGEIIAVSGELNDGKTYVFRQQGSSWSEEAILVPIVDAAFQLRGGDVAIEGDVIVSGNAVSNGDSDHIGNIYRFDGAVWNQEADLRAEDIDSSNRETASVNLENGFVLLGTARITGTAGLSIYGFRYDGAVWTALPKILAVDEPQGSTIPNYHVGLSGDRAVVGTFTDDTQGENAGAVFLFEGVRGSDCNGNKVPDGCDIASGLSVDVDGNGVPDSCQGVVCVADIAVPHNQVVDLLDLIAVLDGFGDCPVTGVCPADITPEGGGNGVVNIDDLVAVLNSFGGCG